MSADLSVLVLLYGAIVGFSIGLTGGGGAIFALPLLIYALGVAPREAVGVSLLAVGGTSLVGFLQRARLGLVEFPTGLMFALAGMIGAPLGSMLADYIPERLLLTLFAFIMLAIAFHMWRKARDAAARLPVLVDENAGPPCRRDPAGKLRMTSQCAMLLGVVGLVTGVLSGLFGVGGGFIIVPALVLFSGMGMQRAIGTSLLVITLVSVAGTTAHVWAGKDLSLGLTAGFLSGSILGLLFGSRLSQRLAGPKLQRIFAVAILCVAVFVLLRSV